MGYDEILQAMFGQNVGQPGSRPDESARGEWK
jgi:hypothetical protein